MNKSHITDEMVKEAREEIGRMSGSFLSNCQIRDVLEEAFPEQQPAAFGPLVVTEEEAIKVRYEWSNAPCLYVGKDWQIALQKFADRHSIKPIAFADRTPDVEAYLWDGAELRWDHIGPDSLEVHGTDWHKDYTHWLPASALPIPGPVDPMEAAWREYCSDWRSVGVKASRLDFLAGYEAGQAGGKQP